MTADNFKAWVSGYLELSTTLSDREIKIKSAWSRLDALDFCYWLSGSFECGGYELTKAELIMQDHLALVFTKVTPDRNEPVKIKHDDIDWNKINENIKKKIETKPLDIWNNPYTNPFDLHYQPLIIC